MHDSILLITIAAIALMLGYFSKSTKARYFLVIPSSLAILTALSYVILENDCDYFDHWNYSGCHFLSAPWSSIISSLSLLGGAVAIFFSPVAFSLAGLFEWQARRKD